MIFQYLDNGERLTVSGWTINSERWGDERWGVSESAIRLPYLNELQRIMIFSRLSKRPLRSPDLGESFKMLETLNHVLVSSRHETYVLGPKSSRRRGADDTGISAQIPIFGCVKNFMHLFHLFISNYLYLSLIISNYTSARRMSYLCTIERKGENGKRKTILAPGLLLEVSNFYSHKRLLRS